MLRNESILVIVIKVAVLLALQFNIEFLHFHRKFSRFQIQIQILQFQIEYGIFGNEAETHKNNPGYSISTTKWQFQKPVLY